MDKQCEICATLLAGKQQRFCSIRCRNVAAGRIGAIQHEPPDKTWLAGEYLLPPSGKGRSLDDIAKELGVSDVTVGKWVRNYALPSDQYERLKFFSSRPKSYRRAPVPNRDELASYYLMPPEGKGFSLDAVGNLYGVSRPTVRRWIDELDLLQDFSERHSQRMAGEGNPAYTNGNTQRYVKRQLEAAQEKVCDWCGTDEKIEIHHINHDRENNDLDNLTWLCTHCNKLEAHLWHLVQKQRATYEVIRGKNKIQLTITFARR